MLYVFHPYILVLRIFRSTTTNFFFIFQLVVGYAYKRTGLMPTTSRNVTFDLSDTRFDDVRNSAYSPPLFFTVVICQRPNIRSYVLFGIYNLRCKHTCTQTHTYVCMYIRIHLHRNAAVVGNNKLDLEGVAWGYVYGKREMAGWVSFSCQLLGLYIQPPRHHQNPFGSLLLG